MSDGRFPDPNELPLDELFRCLNPRQSLEALFALVKREDLGDESLDVTTRALIDPQMEIKADIVARAGGIVAGLRAIPVMRDVYFGYGPACRIDVAMLAEDGDVCRPDDVVARLTGSLAQILIIERPILNLIGRMSGIASLTSRYVNAVSGTQTQILDTRKTTPGLRGLEKYAVRCGGGQCHRAGLYDGVLVKDNHISGVPLEKLTVFLDARLGALQEGVRSNLRFIEIEVDTLMQLEAVLTCTAGLIDIILLDNMTNDQLRDAVTMRQQLAPNIRLEASGGVNLDSVRSIAESGVDRISVGALTHAATSMDFALDVN